MFLIVDNADSRIIDICEIAEQREEGIFNGEAIYGKHLDLRVEEITEVPAEVCPIQYLYIDNAFVKDVNFKPAETPESKILKLETENAQLKQDMLTTQSAVDFILFNMM